MRRRTLLSGAALAAAPMAAPASAASNAPKFRMKYGPHPGMFKNMAGENVLDQIQFSADQGFTAWEDNRVHELPVKEQEAVGKKLEQNGMTMGVFVAFGIGRFEDPDFVTKTDKVYQDMLRGHMRTAVEVSKRVGAKWCTVVPGAVNQKLDPGYQFANCVTNLKAMSEVCEPSGLVMVLEPLNWYTNHPGLFLRSVPQTYAVCKAVGSPSCKILDDLYHQQIDCGNLIPNMELAWDEIPYIQIGDNPGRKEPTTGEINYKRIFGWLHEKGFDGVLGMEHGNSRPGKDGEMAVIAAYRECDRF